MVEQGFALLPGLEAETDVIALAAVDAPGLHLGVEQNVASVEIADTHPPWMVALRQQTRQPSLKSSAVPWVRPGSEFPRCRGVDCATAGARAGLATGAAAGAAARGSATAFWVSFMTVAYDGHSRARALGNASLHNNGRFVEQVALSP